MPPLSTWARPAQSELSQGVCAISIYASKGPDPRSALLKGKQTPPVIGMDEHFFTKQKGYATTLVDLKNHTVFHVVLGRSELSLESDLRKLPNKHRVRIVVMDLSSTYRSIVKRYFPNAMIVADRFHVRRLFII